MCTILSSELLGETWERVAFIRARPVAGDIAQGIKFLKHLSPFIYRKYLDYATIEAINEIRKRIAHEINKYGERNIKLGKGGIREIEFLIQL